MAAVLALRVLAVAAVSLLCATARAASGQNEARAHYEEGVRRYRAGDVAASLASFQAAYALDGRPRLLFNIGQCQRRLGQPAEAIRAFRAYLLASPEADDRSAVEVLIAELEQQIASLPAPPAPAPVVPARTVAANFQPPATIPHDAAPLAPTMLEPSPSPSARSRWPWVAAGVAVVAATAVAVFLLTRSDPRCTDPVCPHF